MDQTAEQLEAQAADAVQRAHDSFQRSDTDGCLSQWAAGIMADLYRRQAQIARAGGRHQFRGLYQGHRRVAAQFIESRFGWVWLLRDDEAQLFGRRFVPEGDCSKVQKRLGLREALEMAPAAARNASRGRGLGGNVWVEVHRTGDRWGTDSTLMPA